MVECGLACRVERLDFAKFIRNPYLDCVAWAVRWRVRARGQCGGVRFIFVMFCLVFACACVSQWCGSYATMRGNVLEAVEFLTPALRTTEGCD
jgi:hypothetical protein